MSKQHIFEQLSFNADGLIPVIAQDVSTGDILMMAWMNAESIEATLQRGEAVYWSRSRQKLWHKGEESGNTQHIHEIRLDCDGDTLLLKVEQTGGIACHTGRHNCFYRKLNDEQWSITDPVLTSPEDMYGKQDD
jgi:phosphoribosyl-AMP cyclohydrolase